MAWKSRPSLPARQRRPRQTSLRKPLRAEELVVHRIEVALGAVGGRPISDERAQEQRRQVGRDTTLATKRKRWISYKVRQLARFHRLYPLLLTFPLCTMR